MPSYDDELFRLAQVRVYLDFPMVLLRGQDIKLFSTMGDRLAVSIAKLVQPERLNDLNYVTQIVRGLDAAFSNRERISFPIDRSPEVTIMLLQWIGIYCPVEARRMIELLIDKLRNSPVADVGSLPQ